MYKLDPSLAEKFVKRLDNRSRLQGIDATLKASDGRAQQRSAEREATRLAKAMDIKSFHGFKSKAKTTAVSSARVVKSIGKTLDVFGGAVESLFAAPQTPERIEQGGEFPVSPRCGSGTQHRLHALHQRHRPPKAAGRKRPGGRAGAPARRGTRQRTLDARRPSPILEPGIEDRDTGGKEKAPGQPAPRPSFGTAIKQLFRDVKTALTGPAPAPQPAKRRRTTDDTERAFRMTAQKIMRRAARLPAEAYATATSYLVGTLDWMNPWPQPADDFEDEFTPTPAPGDHLYPHL